MTVPNSNTFSLLNVTNELNLTGSARNLSNCFLVASPGNFDSTYDNDSFAPTNSLLRFRNYGANVNNIIVTLVNVRALRDIGTSLNLVEYDLIVEFNNTINYESTVTFRILNYLGTGDENFGDVTLTMPTNTTSALVSHTFVGELHNSAQYSVTGSIIGTNNNSLTFDPNVSVKANVPEHLFVSLASFTGARLGSSGRTVTYSVRVELLNPATSIIPITVRISNHNGQGSTANITSTIQAGQSFRNSFSIIDIPTSSPDVFTATATISSATIPIGQPNSIDSVVDLS